MNAKRRHIDDLFAGARQLQPAEPLCTADELRSIVQSAPVVRTPAAALPWLSRTGIRTAAACLAVATIAAGALLMFAPDGTPQHTPGTPLHVAGALPTESDHASSPAPSQDAAPVRPAPVVQPRTVATAGSATAGSATAGSAVAVRPAEGTQAQSMPASPSKIRGLRFLELSGSELERLGITMTDHGSYQLYAQEILRYDDQEARQHMNFSRNNRHNVSLKLYKTRFREVYASVFGGDTTEDVATLKYSIELDTFSTVSKPIVYPEAYDVLPAVSPLIISHDYYRNPADQGRLVATFENPLLLDSVSKFSRQVFEMYDVFTPDSALECRDLTKYSLLSKLVPVYIRMGAAKRNGTRTAGSDIILWYYPSHEFLEALPQHLADKLRIELGYTTLVEEGVLHAEELKQRYCGEYNFLDVCRTKDGAISIVSVAPNPATDRATVRVRVSEQRNFSVSLHDMFGNRVAHLTNLHLLDSDAITIDVSDKPAGTYLIAITSDRGEQVVERLIVSR